MTNKYLIKVAELLSKETKKDVAGTAILGTLGGAEIALSSKLMPKHWSGGKSFAAGVGATLATDYLGLKMGKAFNKVIDDHHANKL